MSRRRQQHQRRPQELLQTHVGARGSQHLLHRATRIGDPESEASQRRLELAATLGSHVVPAKAETQTPVTLVANVVPAKAGTQTPVISWQRHAHVGAPLRRRYELRAIRCAIGMKEHERTRRASLDAQRTAVESEMMDARSDGNALFRPQSRLRDTSSPKSVKYYCDFRRFGRCQDPRG